MKFFMIILMILILFYFIGDKLIEKFDATYQTFQSFIPINAYKYPLMNMPLMNMPLMNMPLIYTPFGLSQYYIPQTNGYTDLPWWNTSLGNTTNMSYDLRGDPLIIPRTEFVWNNGTNFPIYNNLL